MKWTLNFPLKKWTLNVGKKRIKPIRTRTIEKENRAFLTQTSPNTDVDSFLFRLGVLLRIGRIYLIRISCYLILFYSDQKCTQNQKNLLRLGFGFLAIHITSRRPMYVIYKLGGLQINEQGQFSHLRIQLRRDEQKKWMYEKIG